MEIKIKPFKNSSVSEISSLFNIVWEGQEYDDIVAKTNWAFFNDSSKVVLFESNAELIAARGAFEWPLCYNEKHLNTFQFHGTCVHPNFRRKGIFTSINKQFLKEAQEEKFDLIFNVSVDSSRAGYEKLGWVYLKGFRRLTYINKPYSFFKSSFLKEQSQVVQKQKKHFSSSNKFNFIDKIPEEFLISRTEQFKNRLHTNYSEKFIEWRLNNPNENYKIFRGDDCVIVYKIKQVKSSKQLIIGDFFMLKKNYKTFRKNINLLMKYEEPTITFTYSFNTHPYFKYYYRHFFLPNPFNYNLNFGLKTLNNKTRDFLLNKKWGLSFLDIDTF
ncbi:GNAT family N-acetyltransferase [uncultured Flavobacterium sp.]|uniref:GNAT family N-acetyltransferase n=1 Tax=uncultured Flavobacterium sp. TaxID=165435 RepID=UPI0030C7BACB